MKKKLVTFFLLMLNLYAIEVDRVYLEDIVKKNPYDIENRLVLSRYFYEHEEFKKALEQVNKVLKIDSKDKKALYLKSKILNDYKTDALLKEHGINSIYDMESINRLFENLYQNRRYYVYIKLYDYLKSKKIKVSKDIEIDAVESFYKVKNYKRAKKLLNSPQLKYNPYAIKLNILICQKQNDKKCVVNGYKKLLDQHFRKDDALELFDIYFKNRNLKESNELFLKLKNGYLNEEEISFLEKKLNKLNLYSLEKSKELYTKTKSFKNMKLYAMTLFDLNKKDEALEVVKDFNRKNPQNIKSEILLSKLYSWNNQRELASKVLEDVIDKSRDLEALKIYTNMLFADHKYDKARKYFDILINEEEDSKLAQEYNIKKTFCEVKLQEKQNREYIKELLKKANKNRSNGNYEEAINNYKLYYKSTQKEPILKLIADLYYFDKKYDNSLAYYERYLQLRPDDTDARVRYASALEKKKMFKEASVEFEKLSREPSSKQNNYLYHYGFALLKIQDESARAKSRKVLGALIKKLNPNDKIYKFVENAYMVSKRPILRPTRHKDIILAGGQRKILSDNVFEDVDAQDLQIDSIEDLLPKFEIMALKKRKKEVWIKYNYVVDSSDNHIDDYGIGFENIVYISDYGLGANFSRYVLNNLTDHLEINRYKVHLANQKFKIGLGFNQFKNFDEVVPFLEYRDVFGRHHISIETTYENGVFYNYDNNSPYLVNNQIKVAHLYLSDDIRIGFDKKLLLELTVNSFEDKNLQYTPGVRIPLFVSDSDEWINTISLYSSATFNTKENLPYVRQKVEDLNTLEFNTKYKFAQESYISLGAGAGYSFKIKNSVYSAKLGAQYTLYKHYSMVLDCAYLYSENIYDSTQCNALMYYSW